METSHGACDVGTVTITVIVLTAAMAGPGLKIKKRNEEDLPQKGVPEAVLHGAALTAGPR
ncbi:MAG: hypothetical protein FRX49_07381 [Trebouxia sp. A1-2]|nr:MAG: hypothetical protein FRX49_07381 [Trebouxia sp. A1-2]